MLHNNYNSCYLIYFAEIGLGLVTFGLGFIGLGIMLFFDKGLLAMGNVSCVGYTVVCTLPLFTFSAYLIPLHDFLLFFHSSLSSTPPLSLLLLIRLIFVTILCLCSLSSIINYHMLSSEGICQVARITHFNFGSYCYVTNNPQSIEPPFVLTDFLYVKLC